MGKIAEALRANLKAVAQSDARALRELDQELKAATAAIAAPAPAALSGRADVKALLGQGSFEQQTVKTLKQLCRQHQIRGFSKLKKPELCKALTEQGITPPPRPLERFSKKELIALVRQLLEAPSSN